MSDTNLLAPEVVDANALEQLLIDLEWSVIESDRIALADGDVHSWSAGSMRMIMVRDGEVEMRSGRGDVAPGTAAAGALLLVRGAGHLIGHGGAALTVVELEPTTPARRAASLLPDWLVLHDLATLEPDIAQLAAGIGRCPRTRAALSVVCARIATAVVAVATRTWAERGCAPVGWLPATGDVFLTRAVDAIREQPERHWSVGELAQHAAMSRSVFAQRFRDRFGSSPAEFATAIRMDRARTLLGRDGRSVAEVSRMLGYDSDAGFSRAFARHVGTTPSAWRRSRSADRPEILGSAGWETAV